jgi:signal transduction histidine kinase
VGLIRVERPDRVVILTHRGLDPAVVPIGVPIPLDGESVTARVVRTGRSARLSHRDARPGTIASYARRANATSTVGAPVTVEGRLWGVITASWEGQSLPPADAEARLDEFAALLDTAIANADSRDQLAASRARVLSAADDARRQVVRDLHDGAQQRLVHAIINLKLAQLALAGDEREAAALLADALESAEQGNAALRELAHGILPSALTHGGLAAAVDALAARLDLPVEIDVATERLAPEIEASAYFVIAEALTNVVKHARANRAAVTAAVEDGALTLSVRDDGVGGADPRGHGLVGLGDRVAALGGRLRIDSRPGSGTVLAAELPLAAAAAAGPQERR